MKPILTDRMAVIGILAGLVLWVCCLTVLWGWAYDSSGSFSLHSAMGLLLNVWAALWQRGRLARVATRLLRWSRLHRWAPLEAALGHTLGSSKEEVRARMRLLLLAAIAAVIGGIAATLCLPATRLFAAMLGQFFLFDDYTWRGIEGITLLLGAAPAAVGLVCVLYASTVVRASGGRDTYASAYRDWLWGAALGFFLFAVAWWFGTNLIYLVFSAAGGILLAAMTAAARLELSTHPRRELLPFGPPSRWTSAGIAAVHAALLVVLLAQNRLLADLVGLSLTRRLFWTFLSLSLLGLFLSRTDRRARPVGVKPIRGAILGAVAVLAMQAAELLLAGAAEEGCDGCLFFAVAAQIPAAALAAMVMSHQRRTFAQAGGSAGAYLTVAFGGLLAGAIVWRILGALAEGGTLLAVFAGLTLLAAGAETLRHTRPGGHRLEWLGWSVGLTGAAMLAVFSAARSFVPPDRSVQPGLWLTATGKRNRALQQYRQEGLLPRSDVRRSRVLTDCLHTRRTEDGLPKSEGVFALRRGRWWIVSTSAEDLPETLPSRFYPFGAQPEPPALPRRYRRFPPLSYSSPEFFRYARLNFNARRGCDYYDGVMLAPLPADHPQAWRCYNETVLRRCRRLTEMRNPDGSVAYGLLVLRTQARSNRVRYALAVARTFHQAVRSGWAVVAIQRSGLDLLLLGPNEALAAQQVRPEKGTPQTVLEDVIAALAEKLKTVHDDVYLLPIETLWEVYTDVAPLQLACPPGERLAGTPPLEGLRNYLATRQRLLRLEQIRSASRSAAAE